MASITGASRLAAILTLDLRPFLKNTEIAKTRLYKFQQQAQALGTGTLRTIALGFGLISVAAVNVAKNFNEIESQLRAIGGRDNIDKVVDQARLLGRTTKFTSTEVISLGLELRKLGFDADRVTGAMTTATKLSQLFGGDLSKVGVTIAEVQRQFKGANGELRSFEEIGDIFAVAFKESALDITNLGGALKNVGTVANQSGLTLEKTVALLGGLANSGQKAERAGTRLKTTLVRLGRQFGFTQDQTDLLLSGTLDTAQIFDLLKNRAGLAGAVISQNSKEIAILEEHLLDAKGALEAMSQGLEGELFISVAKVKAGFEDMAITLGDALAPYVEILSDYVSDLAKYFEGLDRSTKDAIAQFSILAVVVPVVIAALGGLVALILALSTTVGLVVAGLTLLAGAFGYYATQGVKARKEQEQINKALQQYNDLLESTNDAGEIVFDPLALESSSTFALEQVLANTETAITAAQDRVAWLEGLLRDRAEDMFGDDDIGDVFDLAPRQKLLRLYSQQAQILDILEEREDRTRDLAEERLDLAREYAATLGFTNDLVLQFQQGWEKAGNKIAEALANFGFAVDDLEAVRSKIEEITDYSLTDVLEKGVPKNLLDDLLGKGTLEEQKKLAKALAKEFTNLGVDAAVAGAIDFAKYYEDAANVYEKFVEQLEKKIKLKAIQDARDQSFALAEELKYLGVATERANIEAKLSALNTQLRDLINNGGSANAIRKVADEVELLSEKLRQIDLAEQLKKALGDNAIPTLEALSAGFADTKIEASELTQLQIDKLTKDVQALYQNFNAGGTTSLENVIALLQRLEQLKGLQKQQTAAEAFRDAIKDIYLDFANVEDELVNLGLIDLKQATSQRIDLLRQEIDEYKKLAEARGKQGLTEEESQAQLRAMADLYDQIAKFRDLENASALVGFIQGQISFLGEAFLAAAQNGENFFEVLKKSFLDTFYAIVAKLITLIALYTILAIVSGGSSVGAGGIKGAAAAAIDGGLGSFIGTNLIGLNKSLAVGGGGTPGGGKESGALKVMGAVSGNNLVIMNQRGKRAYDRTFG